MCGNGREPAPPGGLPSMLTGHPCRQTRFDVNSTALSDPKTRRRPPDATVTGGRFVATAPLVALMLCAVVAISGARGTDWPAHLFRIGLFRDAGLTLWNGQWYGGHYTLGYSVVYPPLASWFGPLAVGIASSVVA